MRIDTKKIMGGQLVGDIVWICHYHRPDMQKKALRNVPPTKVIVRDNSELPKNKRVYYSKNHFSPLNKSGDPTAKVISPVDNTGYRSRSGSMLYVFDNEAECIAEWNKQLFNHIEVIDELIAGAAKHWQDEKDKLELDLA